MASSSDNSEWLQDDDLDVLDQLLMEDDLFDADVQSSVENMPKEGQTFPCQLCAKVCLSSGGLKRHTSAKHPGPGQQQEKAASSSSASSSSGSANIKVVEDILHPGIFKCMVKKSVEKLQVDECYPKNISEEFSTFLRSLTGVEVIFPCYYKVSNTILKFNGDAEKFYPEFYSVISSNDVFPGLSNNCKLLLGFELANHVLAHLAGGKVSEDVVSFHDIALNDKQKCIVCYVGGYVVGKLYRKLRFSKSKSDYQEQCISLLETCKYIEGTETDIRYQKLVDLRNRGGLWKINSGVFALFSIVECYFESVTKNFVSCIDASDIVSTLLKDSSLLVHFGDLRSRTEIFVKKEIALNLLADMLTLYIRIRSHSYAKNKQQEHKMAKDTMKAKSLRTEIKRASSNLESGH